MNKQHNSSAFSFRQRILPVFILLFAAQFLVASYWLGAPVPPVEAAPDAFPTLRFSAATYTFNEGDGAVTIRVDVSAIVTQTVTVNYQTLDGSAVAGSDYNTASGLLTFLPTDTQTFKTFTVNLLNDTTPEPLENFNVILQNVQGPATLTSPSTAIVQIVSDDASPTPTGQAATPIYIDIYEPNDTLETATGLTINETTFCNNPNATLWPSLDVDYYRFSARIGSVYTVKTDRLDPNLDTYMYLYGTQGQLLAENDNFNSAASQIIFTATESGYHYVRIINVRAVQSDNELIDQTYCMSVTEAVPTVTPTNTPVTPQATLTRVAGADSCEDNSAFELSCTIGPDQTYSMNFVPALNRNTDNDFYRMWIKAGNIYTCETLNLSNVNDTNMIIYDQNKNGLAGNDDKEPGDLGSKIEYYATYTGWLYVLVGPYAIPIYEETSLYTYDLSCTSLAATPTATPRPTKIPSSGGNYVPPTITPLPTATPQEPIDIEATVNALLPTPTTPPSVGIIPLATSTTEAPVGQAGSMSVVLYHDSNNNRIPEANEGIRDMPVSVYDGVTGQLLAFGYTNQVGRLQFSYVTNSNIVRINVPFLGFDQTATVGTAEVKLRVVPAAGTP